MSRSVAIEGLPGAGKTTLLASLQRAHPDVTVLGELVLPTPHRPSREFFARNDRVKAARCATYDRVLMDRFWASTVAYVLAENRLAGKPRTLHQVIQSLYGRPLSAPSACVLLDPDQALQSVNATDQLFPDPRFRHLLRDAYFEILAWLEIPTLVARNEKVNVGAFVARHLFAD